jgi:[histone H3]-trimethyl-L-lysine9/36 demethylase
MPEVSLRDKQLEEEGKAFLSSDSCYPQPCKHFKPTLEELQSTTFSDYIRNTVLRQSERGYDDDVEDDSEDSENEEEQEGEATSQPKTRRNSTSTANSSSRSPREASKRYSRNSPMVRYDYGIAKVTLPQGFSTLEGIAKDQTARGPDWQPGTPLGDKELPSPMTQVLRGLGGIYEYTFLDHRPMTAAEFRDKADKYIESQLGSNYKDLSIEQLERKFWKRLGPTMQPAMYGADMEGTLFSEDDDCHGFNVSKLQSCLQLLLMDQDDNESGGIPGVTTPYLYFGMWASVFCAHTEDMNLLSINYLHAGAPKVWYAVPAGEDSQRFEHLMEANYQHARKECPEYLRHKRSLISPMIMKKAGIPFTSTVQYPGDVIVTFPGSYHSGFNTGFNIAEATNFAVPEWIPYGKKAKVCLCRPDSVRMDMNKFENLLLRYESEVIQNKRFLWKDWVLRTKKKRQQEEMSNAAYGSATKLQKTEKGSGSGSSKRKEFWVEVMQPANTRSSKSKKKKTKGKKITTGSKNNQTMVSKEVWHLAKPIIGKKTLRPSDRVLCIIPALVNENGVREAGKSDVEVEDEECFAGSVVELHNGHARVRLNGMGKKEDVWMPIDSPKLFMDGGRWEESEESFEMPAKHFWKEEDSKEKCV